jgi:hypothetical protein
MKYNDRSTSCEKPFLYTDLRTGKKTPVSGGEMLRRFREDTKIEFEVFPPFEPPYFSSLESPEFGKKK